MSTTEDDFITVGAPFPQIAAVSPLAELVVLVTWMTGKQVAVDLGPTLHRFKLYAPLRTDRALFETVHVANASTIAWGADDAIDMHVGEVERLAGEAMEAADFKAWMKELGLTLDNAAALLGMSRRMVAYYAGGQEIPRYVALACAYLAATHRNQASPATATLSEEEEMAYLLARVESAVAGYSTREDTPISALDVLSRGLPKGLRLPPARAIKRKAEIEEG